MYLSVYVSVSACIENVKLTTFVLPRQVRAADTKVCDGALTAFRSSVRTVQSSVKLQAYNKNAAILKYFEVRSLV